MRIRLEEYEIHADEGEDGGDAGDAPADNVAELGRDLQKLELTHHVVRQLLELASNSILLLFIMITL